MNRLKTPRFNSRNWEKLAELDESGMPHFEKIYHSVDKATPEEGKKVVKARTQFHRWR